MPSILIIDDEPNIRRMVGALLSAEGYDVREAASGIDGVARIADDEPDAALLDLMMPGELDGIATLARIRERWSDLPVVMMSGRASLGDAVRATKLGAVNFLEKPLSPETVILALSSALELRRTRRAARALREELGLTGNMVGGSAAMQQVRAAIERVAPTESRVLITGESGTGKELVAAAIHDHSARRDNPFVRVNCAAIPRDLVESEMFGHEKGSFTGATSSRTGKFELAHTGTLFLDEIGDLNVEAQAKLLRAIEAHEIQRVGGNRTIKVDVRVIAATNKDLSRAVADGEFREDLYFRLNVIPLHLPPLREREDDVIELVQHFSMIQRQRTGRTLTWSDRALAVMREYPWPGNVRELANIVERLAILNGGTQIDAAHVHAVLPHHDNAPSLPMSWTANQRSLTDALDDAERLLITNALERASGSIAEAARQLQTDRPNLYRRMKRLGISAALLLGLSLSGASYGHAQSESATPADTIPTDTTSTNTTPVDTTSPATDSASPPLFWVPEDTLDADSATSDSVWRAIPKPSRILGFRVTSGKTYNRIEGFPIMFGPTAGYDGSSMRFRASLMGIVRTVGPIRLSSPDGGYEARLATRFGRAFRKQFVWGLGAEAFDVIAPIERWQMTEPEAGLASFLLHRDFLDYYQRQGGRIHAGWYGTRDLSIVAGYGNERWRSRNARDPYTLFRNPQQWRANPVVDEGRFSLVTLTATYDTRNDNQVPATGWLLQGDFEYGRSGSVIRGPRDTFPITEIPEEVRYGRLFVDLRRYTRLSPRSQFNARLVFGGWVLGDELPLQRKLSLGGPGTLPGYDFRVPRGDGDVQLCTEASMLPAGRPALCDRIWLGQIEFRTALAKKPFSIANSPRVRIRSAGFTTTPVGVLFADIGRGWRVGQHWPSNHKIDFGAGLDLGLLGLYVAKSATDWSQSAHFFVRVRRRF